MLPRIDYSVVVPVSVETAFRAFGDLDRLLHRGIYDEASWIEGAPWQVGSRIRYVISKPVKAIVSAVVTAYEPPRFVTLLNHALGVTAEQQVTFVASPTSRTSVRMIMEFVGESPDLPGDALRQALTFFTHDALDSVAALCAKWKAASAAQ